MRWSQLPEEYRKLERTFDKKDAALWWMATENIWTRFNWYLTPQGYHFWKSCNMAKDISELPEIPKF
jgi:hypothetical protein